MTAGMIAPAWMHLQISAEQYDSWSEEDPATKAYRDGEMFTGVIKAAAPFSVTVDLQAT
ncbi:hypothetical protein AB0H45_15500 [Streptomyces atroolivaceus]